MKTRPYLSDVSLKPSAQAHAGRFPFSLPVVRALGHLALHPQVTFFAGENGSGKSTLLEAIAVAMGFNAEGGSRNFRFATRESHSSLHEHLRLARGITLFRGNSFYVLDEPEAALSPQRQLAMLSRLHDLVQDGSQFLIATHSPILMAYPHALIYECGAQGIRKVAYEDTEHYRVMHDFIANPQRMLKVLLEP